MAGSASQEGGQDCSEVLAAAGRLHIPETRTDTVPPSSDCFANLHTCSRPATFREFTSQQLRKIFRSRHGFKLDRHDNIRVIIFGEFTVAFIGHAFIRSAGTETKISFPALPIQPS